MRYIEANVLLIATDYERESWEDASGSEEMQVGVGM